MKWKPAKMVSCPKCYGEGFIHPLMDRCSLCNGNGSITKDDRMNYEIKRANGLLEKDVS